MRQHPIPCAAHCRVTAGRLAGITLATSVIKVCKWQSIDLTQDLLSLYCPILPSFKLS